MKKSVTARFRITKTGKIMRRSTSLSHFRTRKSRKTIRAKRRLVSLGHPKKSIIKILH